MNSNKKKKAVYLVSVLAVSVAVLWFAREAIFSSSAAVQAAPTVPKSAAAPAVPASPQRPKYVRGIHLTAWVAGSAKQRVMLDKLFAETELNTAVIDIKEYEGEIYVPGFAPAEKYKTAVRAIPDIQQYLTELKKKGVYTVARIVVFKDAKVTKMKPEWAVKNANGGVWTDRKGITWVDPYNKEVWDYNLSLAEHAADLGFQEVQFDYIRFPSDGHIQSCRYSQVHSSTTAPVALVDFLKEAHRRLKPKGINISIDVFGLTTSVPHDMGIGQKIIEMTEWVDFVSPMVYPSHYNKGEYRIPDPNKAPYRTVYLGLEGARKKLGDHATKLRPYLQDFSLGYHYGPKEVQAQIQASYDNGIGDWLLWNPRCAYTRAALKGKEFMNTFEKKEPELPAETTVKKAKTNAPEAATPKAADVKPVADQTAK